MRREQCLKVYLASATPTIFGPNTAERSCSAKLVAAPRFFAIFHQPAPRT